MAFRHGSKAAIYVNGTNLSAYCDEISMSIDIDTAETTTFGKTWKTHLPGVAGGEEEISGSYDPTASTGPQAVLMAVISGGTAVPIVAFPGGSATGQRTASFNAILTSYEEPSSVSDKVAFSATFLMDGTPTFGTVS